MAQERIGNLRLLVSSVGSLVGQNILDALEGRREYVHVIGTNLDACNARVFRCDKVYLTPSTDEEHAFRHRMLEIIEREQPHLWIVGRDHDVLVQAKLRESRAELIPILTAGAQGAAHMMQDKWSSWRFACDHGLPFAESVLGGPASEDAALDLARRHGFPLIAKPRFGYGSLGVVAIQNEAQLRLAVRDREILIQQFLSPPEEEIAAYAERSRLGVPLFSTIAEKRQPVCQTIIGPRGEIGEVFCTVWDNVLGRPERNEAIEDPALEEFGQRYAAAAAAIGWVGPFNVQCKPDRAGNYVAFEMNGRPTGNTSSRLALGYDEIGALVRAFVGPDRLPDWNLSPRPRRVVIKALTDGVVDLEEVERLEAQGSWQAGALIRQSAA